MRPRFATVITACMLRISILCTCFLFLSAEVVFSQDSTKPVYISLAYIKVKPGKLDAYKDLLKNYSKKVFQSQVKDGSILGWYLEEVLMPSGANTEYDYVGVTVTNNFKFIIDPTNSAKEIFKKAFANLDEKKIDELMAKYSDARAIVKREIFTTYTLAVPPSGGAPAKYTWIGFQNAKPGKLDSSLRWERDNWGPIHKAAVGLGGMKNWGVYTLQMPYDTQNRYNYLTVNFFDDLSQFESDFKYGDALKKAWPNMDFNKIFALPGADKTVEKYELHKLIEYAQ